jgi:hypothetical protein
MTTVAVQKLLAMPGPERQPGIEEMIMTEFRAALQMESDEPLPMDTPYFELGITSLSLVEARKRLEVLLGLPISSNVMFNQPTLAQLIAYLADQLRPAAAASERTCPDPAPDELTLLAAVLPELNPT